MINVDDVWELERRCWTDGRSFYQGIITEESVYAFPPPMGIFRGVGFVDQMNEDGPFDSVTFEDRQTLTLGDSMVLVYTGTGHSKNGETRKSNCSTVWSQEDTGWKLLMHHQTPLTE